jgi:hypothetical protein
VQSVVSLAVAKAARSDETTAAQWADTRDW